tara:strand:- start:1945 stop:2550 length:606 start_codon:yes stop_codon:yes gene_type:complete
MLLQNPKYNTMINNKDIKTYTVPEKDMQLIWNNTKEAEKAFGGLFMDGKSQIRKPVARSAFMSEDQLVGQIANYCASYILTGSIQGYVEARNKANSNPSRGDQGTDIVGLQNIDIKGSLMRYSSDPLKYRLLVREKERHSNGIYVLALVPKKRPYKTYLVGWAKDCDLPEDKYNGSIKSLHGAYVLEANNLRSIQTLLNED